MKNRDEKIFYTVFMIAVVALAAAATAATPPANLSLKGIADWAIVGGHISSGTGALPAVGAVGERYVDLSTPTAPIEYRSDGSNWRMISGGGGSGTSDHAGLLNLDFAGSGHTGFAASSDLDDYQPVASMAGYLIDADLDPYALDASVTEHINDQIDPHGASMTISDSITVGDGETADAYFERTGTSTMMIASYVVFPPTAATPTATIATGTLWYDSNENKLKVYTGAAWESLH